MASVNHDAMGLSDDQLNDIDEWILDFLTEHEWASPGLMRHFYKDSHRDVTRQWISRRVSRLVEHGHLEPVHRDAAVYRLVDDPREEG